LHCKKDAHMANFYSNNTSMIGEMKRLKSKVELAKIGKTSQEINTYFKTDFSMRKAFKVPH